MELKEWISIFALCVSGINVAVTIGLAVYTGQFRAQVDRDLKRMETRIHAEKWAIDAKVKALTDYWTAVNFIPEVFTQVAQRADPDALQKFRNEASLRLYYAYMTLTLHYDQFDALHKAYARSTRGLFENKRILSPDTFREDEFRRLMIHHIGRTAEDIQSLCRQELKRLYEKEEPKAEMGRWSGVWKMLSG